MSRQGVSAPRNLTLTEELEKLEQSITLTLQEIDHNFSEAHRIVTTSILPVVEQYGEHSRNVWDGSKFWKQFFEASANVSLSGYEEAALEEDLTHTGTASTHDTTFETPPGQGAEDDTITPNAPQEYDDDEGPSMLDSPSNATGVHSTPQILGSIARGNARSPPPPKSSAHRIPYRARPAQEEPPSTPRARNGLSQPDSSPFDPPSAFQASTAQRQNNDLLLHRVLDKNYRVQATPHSNRKPGRKAAKEQATPVTTTQRSLALDSSPLDSSPAAPPPQLRSDLFSPAPPSTAKKGYRPAAPRTPGISVQQTPGTKYTSTGRSIFTSGGNRTQQSITARTPALWDSDSDGEDDFGGMSPPKTMQFAVPQSRLLQTPAREASRKIVEDLLLTAGADATDEIEGVGEQEESPSVVKRRWEDDDTF